MMQLANNIKPISYLKTNASTLAKELAAGRDSLVITENGVPAFVCMGVQEFDDMKQTIALLKLLNMDRDDAGRDLDVVMAELEGDIFG